MYFARPHWLRQWRFWLSCLIPLLALGWLFTMHAQGGQRAFSSGPLSRSHAVGARSSQHASYMAAPKFVENCAGCHLLDFDKRFAQEQVPHDNPDVVHEFLQKRFTEYIAAHPGEVHEAVRIDREIPEKPAVVRVARDAREWIGFRVDEAEDLLWRKTCKECHTLTAGTGPLPEIAKSSITARWMPHAEFSHDSHRMMICESCHTAARLSHETADVLVPSVKTCQKCHQPEGPAKEFAEGRCFECHQYHNWKDEQRVKGTFDLQQLRSESGAGRPYS
jgi:hypothetical protein